MTEDIYICDECNGKGTRDSRNDQIVYKTIEKWIVVEPPRTTCNKCHGSGKLNWIERIFGKQKNNDYKIIEKMLGCFFNNQ